MNLPFYSFLVKNNGNQQKIVFAFEFSKGVLLAGGQSLVILHTEKIGCLCYSVKRRDPIEKFIMKW